jgi:hypothetical protein
MSSVLQHVIIGAGGPCSRWYGGMKCAEPKHLLVIDGERLLDRTVRLCREYGASHIDVIGPKDYDKRYEVEGSTYIPSMELGRSALFEIFGQNLTSCCICNLTTYLHGDVWFSESCFERIALTPPGEEEYVFFGREGAGEFCPWGEMWGMHWADSQNHAFGQVIAELGLFARKLLTFTPGVWNLYNGLQDLPYDNSTVDSAFVEINDETEDFDFPHDFENWMRRHERRQHILTA